MFQNWKNIEIHKFQHLNITIATVDQINYRSGNFEPTFSKDELDLIKDKDFYSFKADYDALFYKLSNVDGPQIGMESIQRFPRNGDNNAVTFSIEITEDKGNNSYSYNYYLGGAEINYVIVDNVQLFKTVIS